jgi:hypothetical protein
VFLTKYEGMHSELPVTQYQNILEFSCSQQNIQIKLKTKAIPVTGCGGL